MEDDQHHSRNMVNGEDDQQDQRSTCLTGVPPGETGTIVAVGDSIRDELGAMGIRPGKELLVQTKQPLGGPVTVSVGHNVTSVSRSYAHQIHINVNKP